MAINVNQVYKAVLVVLQQEKRGVLTPAEFNKIATQAQQEIFTEYFDELNQLLRQPQTSLAYADRYALLDEKISLFKTSATVSINANKVSVPVQVQELGTVVYNNREVQRIQKYEVYTTNISPLTKPTEFYPVYTYENGEIELYPNPLTGSVTLNFLKFPADVKWGFTIDTELGNYIYNEQASTQFEIHKSDQPLLIDKILGYAGVMSRDQLALQLAASKEQQIDVDGQK
jgi:flagellar capping protein FliD